MDAMARRKGKSRRRIKDWHLRYQTGQAGQQDEAARGKFSAKGVKLPASRGDADAARPVGLEDLPKAEGMVVGMFPGGAIVRVAGGEQMLCGIAKTFRAPEGSTPLAVGDVATVAVTRAAHADATEADRDRADGMVISRSPRETALARPQPRSGKRRDAYDAETFQKVIVANMDALLIVAATCQPPLRHGLIDRLFIIAKRGEMSPVLAINKIDLRAPDTDLLDDFRSLEVDILLCSAVTGEGLPALGEALAGRRTVLAGASGVGKSTLINALVPGADAATRTVRPKDKRGRHTTSAAVVYDLPAAPGAADAAGGILVDTPGIRELGMNMDAAELGWYFPEFADCAPQCRFNDCTHSHEPDCAVRDAMETGRIQPRRYASYLRILETLNENIA